MTFLEFRVFQVGQAVKPARMDAANGLGFLSLYAFMDVGWMIYGKGVKLYDHMRFRCLSKKKKTTHIDIL